jgi:pimeloyl-ACP methyl ester carboxylesterase
MAPGAGGTADSFRKVAEHLAPHFTVVLYDRRGFSRSHLTGPPHDARRLDTDAEDLRQLIEHLGGEPAVVFGASSGALVALHLLARHPRVVHTLVPFEPPAVRLLPQGQHWVDFFHSVYDLYRSAGPEPALTRFRTETFAEDDRLAMANAMDMHRNEQAQANAVHWFEHELRQYPTVELDLAALTVHADRIVLAAGRESHGYPAREATVELSHRLGRAVHDLPGGHIGCVTQPAAFATELVQAIAANTA